MLEVQPPRAFSPSITTLSVISRSRMLASAWSTASEPVSVRRCLPVDTTTRLRPGVAFASMIAARKLQRESGLFGFTVVEQM